MTRKIDFWSFFGRHVKNVQTQILRYNFILSIEWNFLTQTYWENLFRIFLHSAGKNNRSINGWKFQPEILPRHCEDGVNSAAYCIQAAGSGEFREIAFLVGLNFFPSSKIAFWPLLKLQKMEFGQISWNRFIWLPRFFGPGLL